jgi:hypothetical protein
MAALLMPLEIGLSLHLHSIKVHTLMLLDVEAANGEEGSTIPIALSRASERKISQISQKDLSPENYFG